MALIRDYIIPGTTIVVLGAYHNISKLNYNKNRGMMDIHVRTYKDKADRDNKAPIKSSVRIYNVAGSDFDNNFGEPILLDDGNSPLRCAYKYLKTLEDFSSAQDA